MTDYDIRIYRGKGPVLFDAYSYQSAAETYFFLGADVACRSTWSPLPHNPAQS